MSDDLFRVPARGINHRSEIRNRTAARNAEIDALIESGASDEDVAARIRKAVTAQEADNAAFDASLAALTVNLVNGSGAPRMEVVESLLGTPQGDDYAGAYGFDLGDFSRDQLMVMRQNGLSWQQIAARTASRKRRTN
ncbi:hypothetical protein [Actinomadura sp. RB99]|uniref:hypothetical protein n=1 Tax=Actinomadura sp. RB99 TaxID=2691577 RepID=UPI0016834EDD|nr:hypothetical protein [Actinomadura sp. RB99]